MSHTLYLKLETDALEITVKVEFTPGAPGRMYLSNGDPGYPDEPPELDYISYEAWLSTDMLTPLPATADLIRVESKALESMVEAWAETPEAMAMAEAAYRDQRDYEMEERHDIRMKQLRDDNAA